MQHNFHVGVGPLGLAANEELTRIYAELWTWPPGTTPAVPAQDMTGDETSGYETTFLAPGPGDYFPKVYADWVIHTPDSDIENGPVKTCPNPP